uniref:HAT C-terminal dimerisation domain-containing protein n=1 Tax=Knipowitschia caucasica TaxID=637954 RepID=A0AAV2LFV6_KNICA
MMSPADVFTVHAHVRTLLQSLGGVGESSAAADSEASSNSSQQAPAPKRSRLSDFAEWENDDDSVTSDQDEVSLYITQKHAMADDRDLLGWWKINSNVYPKLSKLAKSVLCIHAKSSSSSERVFSAAGRTISERRTALKPSTVDAILFLHDAM